MKYKTFFLDFYGTLVHEDGVVIDRICQDITLSSAIKSSPKEIGLFWWHNFTALCENSYGPAYKTQRELELTSIKNTISHFQSSADPVSLSDLLYHCWQHPPIFEESLSFLAQCVVPTYVVSNIDKQDIQMASAHHNFKFNGIVTSEDSRSYKPRPEIFLLALERYGLSPDKVLHIGDSYSVDVDGGNRVGIDTVWLNRKNKEIPVSKIAKPKYIISKLTELFENVS